MYVYANIHTMYVHANIHMMYMRTIVWAIVRNIIEVHTTYEIPRRKRLYTYNCLLSVKVVHAACVFSFCNTLSAR